MKKIVVSLLVIVTVVMIATCFVACTKDEVGIESFNAIEDKTYYIGDTYKSSDIVLTAKMKDGTTANITKNLVFEGDDAQSLSLDENGKFTKAGTYVVKVYRFENREDLAIGEWKIIVKNS